MKTIKSFLYSIAVIAMAILGMTSCSQEDMPETINRDGVVDVVMSTSLPKELETYAVNSADGGLKNLENKDYFVRYIMEIYPKGSTTKVRRLIKYVGITSEGSYRTTSFQTRLLASEYNFVFFADIVREVNSIPYNSFIEGLSIPYYANRYFLSNIDENSDVLIRPTEVNEFTNGDLTAISAVSSAVDAINHPTLEMYDAYSCTELVDLRTEPTTQTFTLKRPFAKLRLITTDVDKLSATPDWSKSRVDISNSNIPTGYNALTGESVTVGTIGYWEVAGGMKSINNSSDIYSNEENTSEKTLYVFYLPVPSKVQNLEFTITVKNASNEALVSQLPITVDNVPLVGNKLTTIKGNFLSKNFTANITVDDVFEGDAIIEYGTEASTIEGLKAAMTGKDQTITYTGNITKAEGFELDFTNVVCSTPVYAEGNTAYLILALPSIEEGAVLTFKGSNAPKTLRIKTDKKCSLRIDLASSDVYYDGSDYKYIVTNSGCAGRKNGLQYEVLFGADPGDRFSPADLTTAHQFKIGADFTLPADFKCVFVKKHENQTCDFINTLQTWQENNSGKNIWDFVGSANN